VIFERTQHASFLNVFFGCCNTYLNAKINPLSTANCVYLSSPVVIFPVTLKHGIEIDGFSLLIKTINFFIREGSKKSSILSLAPSARYDRAQHISIIISS
jgi:hypothetical protein